MLQRYLSIAVLTLSTVVSSNFISTNIPVFAAPVKQATQTVKHDFAKYPANSVYKGKPATLKPENQEQKDYLPEIQSVISQGANFAGHYVIVGGLNRAMGGVSTAAIADLKTGKIYLPSQLKPYHDQRGAGYNPPRPDGGLHYQANSNLLVVTGRAGGSDGNKGIGHYYYNWQNNKLTFIKFVASPYKS